LIYLVYNCRMNGQRLLGPNGLVWAVKEADDIVRIYWGGLSFYAYHENDAFEKKLGIALLAHQGVLYQTICELFDVNRHTVRKILGVYTKSGVSGLQEYHQGPEAIEEALRTFVITEYIRLNGQRGYQNMILDAIAKKVQEGLFRSALSRSKMQKIIKAYKDKTKKEREEEKREAELKKRKEGENQTRQQEKEKEREENDGQSELEQRDQRVCVEHGGAAAVIPLLGQLGLHTALPEEPEYENRHYSIGELAVSYTALNAAQLVDVEQDFKLADSYQIGGIIGRKRLPSLSVYRERIPAAVEKMDMQAVMLEAARTAVGVFGSTRVAYIDGHFIPYYGETRTLYGYNTQRRLAMQGREYVYIHDERGAPIYAALSDGYRKMQYYVEQLDTTIRDIYGARKKEILEVFDRGGYSKEFCISICEKILFVCWRSDARTTPEIPTGEWIDIAVEHQGNTIDEVPVKQMQAWERKRTIETEGKSGTFRELWIKSGQKVSPALSNDFDRPLNELVTVLVGRWGNQENMFKDLKAHGIDHIHSYQNESYSEEYLYSRGLEDRQQGVTHEIGNPKIRALNRQLKQLRNEKKKLEQKLLTAEKKTSTKDEATAIRKKLSGIARKIDNRISARDKLPKTVLMMHRIEEYQVQRLCDGKKMFFDWLKMNAIWAKRQLVDVVKPFYKDLRDMNKFIISILQSRTYVCRRGETLEVEFPPQHSQNGERALEVLCEFLNKKDPFDLGLSFRSIKYRVGEKH
jgi:hypothetical protein